MQCPAKTFWQLILNCGEMLLYGALVGAGLIGGLFVASILFECIRVLAKHFFGN